MAKFDSNYKHLCVMFPGAAGGNHISNLISTVDGFEKLFDSDNYIEDMIFKYEYIYNKYIGQRTRNKVFAIHGTKVHFTNYNNLDHLKIAEEKEQLLKNSKKNILMGHAHCFFDAIVTDIFVDPADCRWLLMSVPSETSLAGKRAIQGEFGILRKEHYRLPTYIGPFKLSETDGFNIDTDLFVSESGWEYLNEQLVDNLGIELDSKTKRMHDLWVANIMEIVNS